AWGIGHWGWGTCTERSRWRSLSLEKYWALGKRVILLLLHSSTPFHDDFWERLFILMRSLS
ncbi:hypothetical protein, partial [aff. Roholtiella sp. LEGE 12411]|uniref:hypothetical protein n=1 Tax=aff. Roholtiella sp. LEGE 12411 TaxID=1828822 RepID=UPI001ABBE527